MLSMVMVTVTSDVRDSISISSGKWAERTSVGIVVLMIVDIFFYCKYTIGRRAGKRQLFCLAMWEKFATFAGSKMDINGSKSKIYSKRRKGV